MIFDASIVDPPPTAKIAPISFSLINFTPSLTESIRGFGFIPDSSKISISLLFNSFITLSYTPFFLMDPPPYVNSTFLEIFPTSSPIKSSASLPK